MKGLIVEPRIRDERSAAPARPGPEAVLIGISSCLLGLNVRYDGGHKHDRFLTDTLGKFVQYAPVCPESECGLSIPREAMRLVGDHAAPRLVTIKTGIDHTDRMKTWAKSRLDEISMLDLCGFIFKSKSPSSGMERVKVYDRNGVPANVGRGIFAAAFMERFPSVPVEDEGRLHDPVLRENFIERVFALRRWRAARRGLGRGSLVDFHSRNKLLLLSHSPKHYSAMGRLVAAAKSMKPSDLYDSYEAMLLDALKIKASPAKHANVLQHMLGYFKKVLTADEKQEALRLIEDFRAGLVPLVVPITIIRHFVRKYGVEYLAAQAYLVPHPVELKLRNHS